MWRNISPAARLLANIVAMIACVLVADPYTPAMFLGLSLALAAWSGALTGRRLLRLVPFTFFALAMVWMNAAWAKVPDAIVIGSLGPLQFTDLGLRLGIALGLRILAVGTLSIVFVSTMDPTEMVLSLVQQFRLSPRLAYSLMAALRFVPTLENEFQIIRAAHRIRGAGVDGRFAWLRRWYRYALPLLAGGIRRAERVALAMEARGFTGTDPRTYFRRLPWRHCDTGFIVATVVVIVGIFLVSQQNGWLTWAWLGEKTY